MIVVDTSLVAYLLIPGSHTDAARAVLARDPEWAAPLLWRSELRNVLATYVRTRRMPLAEAVSVQVTAESLLAGRERGVDSGRVLELAATSGRSAYDCEFVALAEALRVPLVTTDRRLLDAFPAVAVTPQDFADAK